MTPDLSPARIMEVGSGFWASRTLLSAVEIGLFTLLAKGALTGEELIEHLGLHPRAVPDFPDALLALGFLEREGDGAAGRYRNTPETARFLDRNSPDYVGGLLEMFAARLYGFWGNLTEALHSGEPQNEIKATGEPVFAKLYEDPKRLEQFLSAMEGASAANFRTLARKFDFSRYRTLCDIGGASAQLSRLVAEANPHLRCLSFDLPEVTAIAERKIKAAGLDERVTTQSGDFFTDPFPAADVITMGMILHDWDLEKKRMLIAKAYDALPPGGAFIVIEALIDDARRKNVFGLLMSLNMLIEFGDAFDYTAADFTGWCREAGFQRFEVIPLAGSSSAAVAYK
jgi:hypothetical protein